jgi:anti-sigma factor ChrR (cupin superfamily)
LNGVSNPIVVKGLIGRRDWDDLAWTDFRPGVRIHWLYRADEKGPAAALLRYEPGAAVPLHEHIGWEHIVILSGTQSDGTRLSAEGSLMISAPGTRHAIESAEGCVVLAIWERQVRVLESDERG